MILDNIGNWIKDSPKVIALVSIASVFSVTLTIFNGIFTFHSNINDQLRKPKIAISSISAAKRYATTNFGQLLGTGKNYTYEGELKAEAVDNYVSRDFPYIYLKIKFINPSKESVTFSDCQLTTVFLNAKNDKLSAPIKSMAYIQVESYLGGDRQFGNNRYFLSSKEVLEKDLMFIFFPSPEVNSLWRNNNSVLYLSKTFVICMNEFGEEIKS